MKYSVSKTLMYLLVFTLIASAVAYKLVTAGWDATYESYATTRLEE